MLSAAKHLCAASEMLRCAQHDRSLLILVVNIHQNGGIVSQAYSEQSLK